MRPLLVAPAAAVALAWLWFLARGRAPGAVKRLALRATLLAIAGGLVFAARWRKIFERASPAFSAVLLLAIVSMVLGYLYLLRFCDACGRLVRDLKPAACPRCGAALPRHGMTHALRRPGDDERRPPMRAARRRGER